MGKPKATKDFTRALTDHYGVALTVTTKATKGSTGAVLINNTQAVAGVSLDKGMSPSKSQCGDIADQAETQAEKLYSEEQKKKKPKKMSGGDIYAVGN